MCGEQDVGQYCDDSKTVLSAVTSMSRDENFSRDLFIQIVNYFVVLFVSQQSRGHFSVFAFFFYCREHGELFCEILMLSLIEHDINVDYSCLAFLRPRKLHFYCDRESRVNKLTRKDSNVEHLDERFMHSLSFCN